MGRLDDWTDDGGIIDGRSLDPTEIVRKAARGEKSHFGDMDIVDEQMMDAILNPDVSDCNDYFILDDHEGHDGEVYNTPGRGRHHSDSIARS
jgi:hypothetical protein